MEKTKSKLVIIIGGSGGIGSEIALAFLKNNYRVCLTYNKNKERVVKILSKFASSCFAYQMDLRKEKSVCGAWQQIIEEHGCADLIIFAPSTAIKPLSIGKKKWNDFNEHLLIQVKGLFLIVQNVMKKIEEHPKARKFIVLLTESCTGTPPSSIADYVVAKYALQGLSKCLAVELPKYGCTVNMISPGMIDTGLLSNLPPKLVELTVFKNPFRRLATPKDVASAALFLASDGANYINGANILINGGGVMV